MEVTVVQLRPEAPDPPGEDRTPAVLAFLHRLLLAPTAERNSWSELLFGLARAFGAAGAGVGQVQAGTVAVRHRVRVAETPPGAGPWEHALGALAGRGGLSCAVSVRCADGSPWLLTTFQPTQGGLAVLW